MADASQQQPVSDTSPNGISTSPSKDTLSGFSAGVLRDRLSTLAATPVQALQANVSFVPATVPKKRRLQTLAVTVYSLLVPLFCAFYMFLWSFPAIWPFLIAYTVWILWIDKAQDHGGRFSPWFRGIRFFKYFVDYYPASFLKTCDLPADRPYVFGYHPHGIIGTGAIATFATSASGFPSAFPGITPHLLTLASNFRLPFYRDFLLAQGICSVSKKACSAILKEGGPGAAIVIVVGGAAESLSAHPGTADLTLRKRLGFIKVAIQHGASLVPVFAFGENDIYQQMPNEKGTLVYSFQKKFQSLFGFTLPLFHGRGILNYNLGLLPYRRRIVSVIGRPIECKQSERPTSEEVTAVQQQYIAELMHIWDTYKDEFARSRKRELSIIE